MPKALNTPFLMPAEWEPHTATWLAWPHNKQDWPGKFEPIYWVYAEIIRNLAAHERVRLLTGSLAAKNKALDILERAHVDLTRVDFWFIPTNRVWVRDSGAIFVKDSTQKTLMLDWRFNAWAKYHNHQLDNKVPQAARAHLPHACVQPVVMENGKERRVVLEGGAIDVNGKGALITTEECLLSEHVQCRNPGFTRAMYEEIFAKYLGIQQIIWLGKGIAGDDTHGHVDDITRFVAENTIVTVVEQNAKDDNHAPLRENLKRLKAARTPAGKAFDIVELPMPRPLYFEGTRLPASYANFYIANGVVLVPTFNDLNDRIALNILADLFPTREITGIHAVDLVWGFGTLHCMTQQEIG